MLGLDLAPANRALGGSESEASSWETVTQTEQNRKCNVSPFFYGIGGTKFRKKEDFVFDASSSTGCSERFAVRVYSSQTVRSLSGSVLPALSLLPRDSQPSLPISPLSDAL
jgi:hypothetical protein